MMRDAGEQWLRQPDPKPDARLVALAEALRSADVGATLEPFGGGGVMGFTLVAVPLQHGRPDGRAVEVLAPDEPDKATLIVRWEPEGDEEAEPIVAECGCERVAAAIVRAMLRGEVAP